MIAVDEHAGAAVRRELSRVLKADPGRVREGVRADVELLVTELVSNVVRHERARIVNIEVAVEADGSVTVTVTGGVADPSPALVHPPEAPAPTSERGRGLIILDSVASTWGTQRRNGKTAVWFTVNDNDDNAFSGPDDKSDILRALSPGGGELPPHAVEGGAAAGGAASREDATTSARVREQSRQLQRAGRHDRIVALALQEAMLAPLPESDELRLAARYLTAAEQDQIGGDWYDAVVLPTGTTSLVIGDVIGHDIQAAAAMGQLRNVLRALIWDRDEAPHAVATRLDRAIRDLHINTIATLILVNVEPPSPGEPSSVGTLRWTNAGHPAPVLIHSDGTAIALDDTSDLLLGVQPASKRHDHTHPVPPGATLLLYTDGLVETRAQGIEVGQLRLLDAVRAHHHLEPGDLLDAVLTDMVGDRPDDDVAVLAARFATPLRVAGRATG